MKTGNRTSGPATLRVRRMRALPLVMQARTREVVNVETPTASQGLGHATKLMNKVCSEADRNGMVLMLSPQPYGDYMNLSKQQLQDWYARSFGFEVIQEEPMVLMARLPRRCTSPMQLNPITEAIHKDQR